MASSLQSGLTPAEIGFLCEMELVTVIPRQKLESLTLLGGRSSPLRPPHRTDIPLWLALLLKRQKRVDIVPPSWLHPTSLTAILEAEAGQAEPGRFASLPDLAIDNSATPPFQCCCTATRAADALPYHWLEVGTILLNSAPEDIFDEEQVRRLLRDIREVRLAKVRALMSSAGDFKSRSFSVAPNIELGAGAGINLSGIGALELSETRKFVSDVMDGLRKLTASREVSDRERVEEERQEDWLGGFQANEDEDEDILM